MMDAIDESGSQFVNAANSMNLTSVSEEHFTKWTSLQKVAFMARYFNLLPSPHNITSHKPDPMANAMQVCLCV